jgi:hypothetical protein
MANRAPVEPVPEGVRMFDAPEPTTRTETRPHGEVPRGLLITPSSSTRTGRFGRMFRRLPVYEHRRDSLIELAEAMIQRPVGGMLDGPLGAPDQNENTSRLDGGELRLPAGYTYFGQFVDHDITFDPASSLTRQNDPNALVNFRTPRFDLDSLYGGGPASQPFLYDTDGVKLELGDRVSNDAETAGPDLLRANERALIGDPRNDENLIVSQLQVALIRFHNAVVDRVRVDNPNLVDADVFKRTQLTVRWHYQWVVVRDFLRRLVNEEVVADILRSHEYASPSGRQSTIRPRLLFYEWKQQPFMPVEFSVAAYRFGHSMARPSYLINDAVRVPVVNNARRIPLFSAAPRDADRPTNLNGFGPLPAQSGVQWKYFLTGIENRRGPNDQWLPQPSYKINTQLAAPLGELPGFPDSPERSLAVRNLLRGWALQLPAGQDVARAMGIQPLDEALLDTVGLSRDTREDLRGKWPLWFYVLKEAEVLAGGAHLGPVGGRIVAEVLIGLLEEDPLSFLSVSPTWKPFLGATPGEFTLSDLINFWQ